MKKLYIIIAFILWGSFQPTRAQNMYRGYQCPIHPNSSASVVHSNGYIYFFQADNLGNLSVAEINPLSMSPTVNSKSFSFQNYHIYLNGAFETFTGDFILYGYCINNNSHPVLVKVLQDLSYCILYFYNDEGEFIAGCSGKDIAYDEVYVLVSNGKLYEVKASNLNDAYRIDMDIITNPNDQYSDISWDDQKKKFIATGSTWNGSNSWLNPFVEVFDLNSANVFPIAEYIIHNQSYDYTNESRTLHSQLSDNELILYQDLRNINSNINDIIWLTRINNFWNASANIVESYFYILPNTKLTAKDMIYDLTHSRLNFLGVYNHCIAGLTQILAQVKPYSLSSGIEIGQLGASFTGGYCTDIQDPNIIIHYDDMEMFNLSCNIHNPCYPILVAGVQGGKGILTETYDISLSLCDIPLWHKDIPADPTIKPYTISTPSNIPTKVSENVNSNVDNIFMSKICGDPVDCSYNLLDKSLNQDIDVHKSVAEVSILNNQGFVCEGFDGEINYYIYDMTGKLLNQGTTRNFEKNQILKTRGVFLLKANDSIGNHIVKKVVIL